jgi:uncharacterized protein YlxW (UPF0749 family)
MISEQRVEKALEFIRDNAPLVGQLRGQQGYLGHHIKMAKAESFLKFASDLTVREREQMAEISDLVVKLVDDLRDCETELYTLQTRIKAAELTIETWRSQNAALKRGNV